MRAVKRMITVSFLAASSVLLLQEQPARSSLPDDEGENLFMAKCTICHGTDGSGNTPTGKKLKIPDLRSANVQEQSDEQLILTVTNGRGNMPAFEKRLREEQIRHVIAHLRRLDSKP